MNREEWLEERKKGIGGSDVACILGMSPYKSNVELWEEKVGIREAEDISEKEYVKNGTDSEDPLRKLFAIDYKQYEVLHEENEIIHNKEYPFIQVSPDSKLIEKETGRKGFLEIKRCEIMNYKQYEKWKDGNIPQNYYLQTLQYFLADEDMDFGYLRAYLIRHQADGTVTREIRDYVIANNRIEVQDDLDYLKPKEIEFWYYVENKIRPALILPEI